MAVAVVSVFAGALVSELLKRTEVVKRTTRGISTGFRSAKEAFKKGYESVAKEPEQASG